MGLFSKKAELGFEPLGKLKPVKVKNNVATSKLLGYKFTLPEGFFFEDLEKYNADSTSLTEFSAANTNSQTLISCLITPSDSKDANTLLPTWESFKPKLEVAMLSRVFRDFEESRMSHKVFLGYNCAYYSGVLTNEFRDGRLRHRDTYLYLTPFAVFSFSIITLEDASTNSSSLFKYFEDIK